MNIGHALSTVLKIGTARKLQPGDTDDSEQIGWGYGIAGIVLLVIVQIGLILSAGPLDGQTILDISIVTAISLGTPFVVYLIAAAMTGNRARLPASFLYLGIILSLLQIISAIVQSFNSGSSFILGATAVLVATGARGFFKLGWVGAVIVAVITVAAVIGAGILLLSLPTGRLLR